MTELEHQRRHQTLHAHLDELVADWIDKTGNMPSKASVMELMEWSNEQCKCPATERVLGALENLKKVLEEAKDEAPRSPQ